MKRKEIIDYLRNEYDEQWLEILLKLVSLRLEFVKSINELEKELIPNFGNCSKCGADIKEETDKYCWHCGKKLEHKEIKQITSNDVEVDIKLKDPLENESYS